MVASSKSALTVIAWCMVGSAIVKRDFPALVDGGRAGTVIGTRLLTQLCHVFDDWQAYHGRTITCRSMATRIRGRVQNDLWEILEDGMPSPHARCAVLSTNRFHCWPHSGCSLPKPESSRPTTARNNSRVMPWSGVSSPSTPRTPPATARWSHTDQTYRKKSSRSLGRLREFGRWEFGAR